MAKSLFKNYSLALNKNEAKFVVTICNQINKQLQTDPRNIAGVKIYKSIIEKVNTNPDNAKLTKEEFKHLKEQLKANREHLETQMAKSWFLKKLLYRTLLSQYKSILNNHFSD